MEDWKQRTNILIGVEGVEKLAKAHVLVVGLGGVEGRQRKTSSLHCCGQSPSFLCVSTSNHFIQCLLVVDC